MAHPAERDRQAARRAAKPGRTAEKPDQNQWTRPCDTASPIKLLGDYAHNPSSPEMPSFLFGQKAKHSI